MNDTQAILKLAAKFGNAIEVRQFSQYVQFVKDFDNDKVKFYASNGHIVIKVTSPDAYSLDLKEAIKIEIAIMTIKG